VSRRSSPYQLEFTGSGQRRVSSSFSQASSTHDCTPCHIAAFRARASCSDFPYSCSEVRHPETLTEIVLVLIGRALQETCSASPAPPRAARSETCWATWSYSSATRKRIVNQFDGNSACTRVHGTTAKGGHQGEGRDEC